jgi:hypothetical protein
MVSTLESRSFDKKIMAKAQHVGKEINEDNLDEWVNRAIENFDNQYERQSTRSPANAITLRKLQ